MKKGVAIGGLILVTVIWGGGFVASDMALESMEPISDHDGQISAGIRPDGTGSNGTAEKRSKDRESRRGDQGRYADGTYPVCRICIADCRTAVYNPFQKCISYRIERRYRTVYCICDSEKEGRRKRNYRGDYGSSRSRTAFPERKSDTWYRRSAVTFLRRWICISDFPDRRICKKISGSPF